MFYDMAMDMTSETTRSGMIGVLDQHETESMPCPVIGSASLAANLVSIMRLWLQPTPSTRVSRVDETGIALSDKAYCGARLRTIDGRVFDVAVIERNPEKSCDHKNYGHETRSRNFPTS
jgi:hypothetical protein